MWKPRRGNVFSSKVSLRGMSRWAMVWYTLLFLSWCNGGGESIECTYIDNSEAPFSFSCVTQSGGCYIISTLDTSMNDLTPVWTITSPQRPKNVHCKRISERDIKHMSRMSPCFGYVLQTLRLRSLKLKHMAIWISCTALWIVWHLKLTGTTRRLMSYNMAGDLEFCTKGVRFCVRYSLMRRSTFVSLVICMLQQLGPFV